jgi:superfamily II DNA or RNA helicase
MLAYSDFIPIFASHYQGNSFNLNNYIMTKVTINQPEFNQYILDLYESKGLKPFDYQIDFLTNTRFRTTEKTIVLAGGTSSGKTIMSLAWLESQDLEGTINVIIPSATKVLRDNFEDSIFGFQPSFNYRVVVDGQDLRRAIKDKVEVIICLPQTLGRNLDLLPKINNLVVDEAHLWATAPTVQSIIETCKPTRQLFLTGTPFQFNGQSDKYEIKHVSVQTLLQLGKVTNTAIKVVSSTYTMNNDDYNQTGDVKESTILF